MLFELFKIIIAAIGATFTYVITKFILDNILEQKKIINDISYYLTFYANIYCASIVNDELIQPVSDKFRELSARLSSTITIIPRYKWLEFFKFVLKTDDIKKASGLLMRISNSIGPAAGEKTNYHAEKNEEDAEEVVILLKIKIGFYSLQPCTWERAIINKKNRLVGGGLIIIIMVGTRGFEPPTPASRTLCSTRLSHVPTCFLNLTKSRGQGKRNRHFSGAGFQPARPVLKPAPAFLSRKAGALH